jgi:hypothetical protein
MDQIVAGLLSAIALLVVAFVGLGIFTGVWL